MKRALIILFSLFNTIILSSQSRMEYYDDSEILNHDFEKVIIVRIDKSDSTSRIETTASWTGKDSTIYQTLEYSNKGRLKNSLGYTGYHFGYEEIKYEYNRKGQLKRSINRKKDGSILEEIQFTYSRKSKTIREQRDKGNGRKRIGIKKFGKNNRFISQVSYFETQNHRSEIVKDTVLLDIPDSILIIKRHFQTDSSFILFYEYFQGNQIAKSEVREADNSIQSIEQFSYNEQGMLMSKTFYFRDLTTKQLKETERTELKYNSDNLLFERYFFEESRLKSVETFQDGLIKRSTYYDFDLNPTIIYKYIYE